MCGIVGFTGTQQAAPILLDGLSKLEYRGYDSAGLAVRDQDKETEIVKAKGRLKILMEKTNNMMNRCIQNKKEEFINKVDDMKKFLELMKEFKSLNYDSKIEIAVDAFGDNYWKYI